MDVDMPFWLKSPWLSEIEPTRPSLIPLDTLGARGKGETGLRAPACSSALLVPFVIHGYPWVCWMRAGSHRMQSWIAWHVAMMVRARCTRLDPRREATRYRISSGFH